MYNVAVFDDDVRQAEAVAAMVAASSGADRFFSARVYGIDRINDLVSDSPGIDILISDIKLGESGVDAISLVKRHFPPRCGTQVIYVTGYADEYHTRVYQTEHVYFIAKPVSHDELDAALGKACARLRERLYAPISVTFERTTHLIQPARISYIESVRRKVRIVMDDRTVETYAKLEDIKELLPTSFLQCHKSYLVNMSRIASVERHSVRLLDGAEIPVSQRRRDEVRASLASFARSLL